MDDKFNKDEDIERIFNQEVRDKKRTASGVYHRASRRGLVGTVRTQVDYLKGKAKKLYMGNGDIKVSNMYDTLENIPSLDELKKMDFDAARNIIGKAKKGFRIKELVKHWGVSDYTLYNKVFTHYKIEYEKKPKKILPKAKTTNNVKQANKVSEGVVAAAPVLNVNTINTNITFTGFEIKFGGTYSGKQIADRLMNYIATLDPTSKYSINFKTAEIEDSYIES